MSHRRHKLSWWGEVDVYLSATDVYFNSYPEYTVSCGSHNSTFHLLDKRIINCLSSNLIRNAGLSRTIIQAASQYLLTDIEELTPICVFWGFWDRYPDKFYYSDFHPVYLDSEYHSEYAWYSKPSNSGGATVIRGVNVYHIGTNNMYIDTNPPTHIIWSPQSAIN